MAKREWWEFYGDDGRICCASRNPASLCAEHRTLVRLAATAAPDEESLDGYSIALAKRAQTAPTPVVSRAAEGDPFGTPPDGYAIALAKRREQEAG
jgi:hypothetical protein